MKVFTITAIIILAVSAPVFSGGQSEEPPLMDGGTMEAMDKSEDMDGASGTSIVDFKSADQVMMLAEEKPTVLFFNASWCPSCKSAVRNFKANESDLEDVNLVFVDYDNSDDLQRKYGVTYQHTFVQIDSSGEAVTKWNGGGISELLENIKEM